jgi:hypothetical protein
VETFDLDVGPHTTTPVKQTAAIGLTTTPLAREEHLLISDGSGKVEVLDDYPPRPQPETVTQDCAALLSLCADELYPAVRLPGYLSRPAAERRLDIRLTGGCHLSSRNDHSAPGRGS